MFDQNSFLIPPHSVSVLPVVGHEKQIEKQQLMKLLTVIFHSHLKSSKYCQTSPQSQRIPTPVVSFF